MPKTKIQIIIDTLKNIAGGGDQENYTLPFDFCRILQLRPIEHDQNDYIHSKKYKSDNYGYLYFWENPPFDPNTLRHVRDVSWNVYVTDDPDDRPIDSLYLTNQFGVGNSVNNSVNDFINAVRAYEEIARRNYLSEEDESFLRERAKQPNNPKEIGQGDNESEFVNRQGKTNISEPRNLIYFGAPGTGKSYKLNESLKDFKKNFERVTFYPTYSYAQFVGTYKPVMKADGEANEEISYEFVPGPFLRVLVQALKNQEANYCLVIEEINRANAAAVFGDVFQLLDRDTNGVSEYKIATSEDVKKYLFKILGKESFNLLFSKNPEQIKITQENLETISISLYIPQNMYIWATMNSADQGVFPMDTAFKRRWSFEYIGIDNNEHDVGQVTIEKNNYSWNNVRKLINKLLSEFNVNEDKLMGPFFVKAGKDNIISKKLFESKVLMYLWEDAARMIRKNIFGAEIKTYSQLVSEWNSNNIHIFDNCSDKWRNNNDLFTLYNNIITQQNAQTNTQAEGENTADNGRD